MKFHCAHWEPGKKGQLVQGPPCVLVKNSYYQFDLFMFFFNVQVCTLDTYPLAHFKWHFILVHYKDLQNEEY